MKLKLLFCLCVLAVGIKVTAENRMDEVFVYNDYDGSIKHEETDGRYNDSKAIILLSEDAGVTDTLFAEERSKEDTLPIYRVSPDSFDYSLLEQDRRQMYVYGDFKASVLAELESNGFRNMGW